MYKLLAALILLTTACGPAGSPAPVAGQDEPRMGGRVTIGFNQDLNNFDPSIATRAESSHFAPIAYESLLTVKTGPHVGYMDLVLQPRLAERWEVSSDGRTYTFHLRKGARFADTPPARGREVTASDVKFSYEYWSRTGEFKDFREKKLPPGTYNYMLEGLEAVEVRDPQTPVVRFKDPFVPFLNYAASYKLPVAPREIYDQDGHFQERAIGTAAFQLDLGASQSGSHWSWKKNPKYWDPGRPYLDEVRTLRIVDDSAEIAAFQTKQIDSFTSTQGRLADELRRSVPDLLVDEYTPPFTLHMWMEMRPGKLLTDQRLRKAVSLAIDRDEFVRVYSGGRGQWALAGVFPGFFTEAEVKQVLRYDPVEAKRLVTEAGYPQGVEMNYMLTPDSGQLFISQSELLQAQLKKAGITLNMRPFTNTDAALKRRTGDWYDIAPTRRTSLDSDVDSNIFAAFHSGSQNNFGRVNDPKLDALVEAQRRETDPAKRREIVREAARYIGHESLGMILPYEVEYRFTQGHVRGFNPNFAVTLPLTETWLAK